MAISVREMLKVGGFMQCRLVAGANGLDKNIVYAGSMEIPEIKPWLIAEQILVTTGYAIKGEPHKITALVQDLYDKGASALAIKTKFTGEIPPEAYVLADQLAIPLIEIPYAINFVDLFPAAIQAISVGEMQLLAFSREVQNQCMELDRMGGGAQNIANMVSNLLLGSVQITDALFSTICSSKKEDVEPNIVFPLLLKECRSTVDAFASSTQTRLHWLLASQELNYIIKKISLKEKTIGYIIICSRGFPNQLTNIVIDHAATVMAVEFAKLQSQREQQLSVATNLYTDIISENIKGEEEAVRRAFNLNWPTPPFSFVSFDVNSFETVAKAMDENKLQQVKNHIHDRIRIQLFPDVQATAIIMKSDSFNCLIPGSYKRELIALAIENIREAVKKELNIVLTAGVTTEVSSYLQICFANAQVRDAIKICRLDQNPKGYAFADALKIEQFFLHMEHSDHVKQYMETTLAKLIVYDKENATDLVHTLRILTQCMGARLQTAALLFIHRNTLKYRLKRIELIAQCDLDNPKEIWALGLAFRALQYGGSFYKIEDRP